MFHNRIEKLSSLLDENETQLNMANKIQISIEHDNAINDTSDNSCSSTTQLQPLLIPKSKRYKVNSSIRKHKCETC